jgi:large subunit ribosomal protein L9
MKLLLRRDVSKVGLAGDVVDVSEGYARNYLLPQHMAVLPTQANMKRIEEDMRIAEEQRRQRRAELEKQATRLRDVEVTISAACNPEGHLYGSVGPREIAASLRDEGHDVEAKQVQLSEPIRQLDTVSVPVQFADDLVVEVKVWVVRETGSGVEEIEEAESHEQQEERTEADDEYRGPSVDALDTEV